MWWNFPMATGLQETRSRKVEEIPHIHTGFHVDVKRKLYPIYLVFRFRLPCRHRLDRRPEIPFRLRHFRGHRDHPCEFLLLSSLTIVMLKLGCKYCQG